MASDKTLFSPVPLRAMAADLSGLQLRVLICVAAHDRLSLVTGKGQGCRASNERMAQMVQCSYARLCSTLSELVALDYLSREKPGRHTIYRVKYTDFDRLLFGNVIGRAKGALKASRHGSIGCQAFSETGGNLPEPVPQYISLNEGIDSEESGEDNSSEEARLSPRGLSNRSSSENVGGELARLERALKEGGEIDTVAYLNWIGECVFTADHPDAVRSWALRLSDKLYDVMTPDDHARWEAISA